MSIYLSYDSYKRSLPHPQPPEGCNLRRSGGAERVCLVGGAGMSRPDISFAEDNEPRLFKGGEQFCPRPQFQMFRKILAH